MYLSYVPNRHVRNAFVGHHAANISVTLDEFGMVPYNGNSITPFTEKTSPLMDITAAREKTAAMGKRIHLLHEPINFKPIIFHLMGHSLKKPFYQELDFTLINRIERVKIEAVIYSGTMECFITPSTDELRRKLCLLKKEASLRFYQKTNMQVQFDIADEIRTGKL